MKVSKTARAKITAWSIPNDQASTHSQTSLASIFGSNAKPKPKPKPKLQRVVALSWGHIIKVYSDW